MTSWLRTRSWIALGWLAACGGDHRDTPVDGAPMPTDAMTDDAPPPPPPVDAPSRVSVTVLTNADDGGPDTTARVIFADASRQLVKQDLVDATGSLSADLPAGGFVHVLHVFDSTSGRGVNLTSIRVKPGDHLTFGVAGHTPQGAAVTVQGTFTPIENVSTNYAFAHRCGSGDALGINTARLSSVAGCLSATFDVLGTNDSAASEGISPHYVWFTATPAGGFAAPAMQEMPPFTATIHAVPVGSAVQVRRMTLLPPYYNDAAAVTAQTVTAADANVPVPVAYPPPPAGTTAIGVVEARVSPTTFDPQLQVIRTRVAGNAASSDLDLAALPLPVVQTAPTLSGKVVSWTQTGTGTPDLREVSIPIGYKVGTLNYTMTWTVIDGAADSSVELPGLPTMFADFDPTQQPAPVSSTGTVLYIDYSNVQGFDAARQLPLGSLDGHNSVLYGAGLFEGQLYSVHASMHF
ncbi:MAG TPA: hypothetical protein VHW23_05995 [Kofleriaceae bacterium]|jgi:hypothetical protein|nr:hypothetical protein [Kofleriaceae bacterium]